MTRGRARPRSGVRGGCIGKRWLAVGARGVVRTRSRAGSAGWGRCSGCPRTGHLLASDCLCPRGPHHDACPRLPSEPFVLRKHALTAHLYHLSLPLRAVKTSWVTDVRIDSVCMPNSQPTGRTQTPTQTDRAGTSPDRGPQEGTDRHPDPKAPQFCLHASCLFSRVFCFLLVGGYVLGSARTGPGPPGIAVLPEA